MLRRTLVCLALSSTAAVAATPDFLLGRNYTEWGPYIGAVQQIAADSSGALCILSLCTPSDTGCPTGLKDRVLREQTRKGEGGGGGELWEFACSHEISLKIAPRRAFGLLALKWVSGHWPFR